MSTAVTMPQLGESVTEGTVTRWLKNVGDHVAVDEPLLEVSTDKVDTEIPAPVAGVLLEIAAVEDDVVPVGGVLARIGELAEAGAPAAEPPAAAVRTENPAALPPVTEPTDSHVTEPAAASAVAQPSAPSAAAAVAAQPAAAGGQLVPVALPALGESVTEGTVTRWLRSVGDVVVADQPLLEVSTDKVDTELPAPVAGTLAQILVAEDETVDVGTTLAMIDTGSDGPPRSGGAAESAPPAAATTEPGGDTWPATGDGASPAVHASPLVRRAAREAGVDLTAVAGTGVGGRITRDDVARAAGTPAAAPLPPSPAVLPADAATTPTTAPPAATATSSRPDRDQTLAPAAAGDRQEPLPRLRRLIASRMVESLRVSAQLTTVVEVDVTNIARLRKSAQDQFTAREGVRLTFTPFFARAVIEGLRAHPALNASLSEDGTTITQHGSQQLGIAVDTDRGLLVPVVRDAGDLTLGGLARRIADLATRTRAGQVTPDDLAGATFTLTNTGSRGALFDTPIISQPQVGILGTGAVVKRPVVVAGPNHEDVIAIRSMAFFALTYDHRLIDGADAARFLSTVKARLEQADFAAELGVAPGG